MNYQLQADNLLMLMEWLRLGKTFHIHKEFMLYLEISDIANTCLISKHYFRKYFKYSCFHYISANKDLLDELCLIFQRKKMTSLEILIQGELSFKNYGIVDEAKIIHTFKKIYQSNNGILKKIIHELLDKKY